MPKSGIAIYIEPALLYMVMKRNTTTACYDYYHTWNLGCN